MQPEIIPFAERLSEKQRAVALVLHREIMQLPGMALKERYKLPFYYGRSWICYINSLKNNSLELCFLRGVELVDVHGILSANGRKQVRGIQCTTVESLPIEAIRNTLHEAYFLDREEAYIHPVQRKYREKRKP